MADVMDGDPILTDPVLGDPFLSQFFWPDGVAQTADNRAQLIWPQSMQPDQPMYLLEYNHGKGGHESTLNEARTKTTSRAFIDNGNWMILQSKACGPAIWGQTKRGHTPVRRWRNGPSGRYAVRYLV